MDTRLVTCNIQGFSFWTEKSNVQEISKYYRVEVLDNQISPPPQVTQIIVSTGIHVLATIRNSEKVKRLLSNRQLDILF